MSAETARCGWSNLLRLDRWTGHSAGPSVCKIGSSSPGRLSNDFSPVLINRTSTDVALPPAPQLKPSPFSPPCPSPLLLPPAMCLRAQTLAEVFVRSCSCKDSSCSSCSCTLASTPPPVKGNRSATRNALAELRTESNILTPVENRPDSSPSPKLSSVKLARKQSEATPNKQRNKPLSPSPRLSSPSSLTLNSRSLERSRSGKRGFSDSGAELTQRQFTATAQSFCEAKENEKVAQQAEPCIASPFKRKRPPKLQIPNCEPDAEQTKVKNKDVPVEVSAEGKCYGMYSKKGHRDVLEDTYQAVPDIDGTTQQAFFGIFDGHGGRKAAEFAADHLSQNIRDALKNEECELEEAVRTGYLTTDAAFLQKQLSSGASCVTALVKDEALVVANAGDCRAVMSRSGKAVAVTEDHRLAREDERRRVEELGGYVDCFSGVWRLQGILAVSRGIGDIHLKDWVSAEPEIHKLSIGPECEFLILASDGLWDVVSNQEAVDCIRAEVKWTEKGIGGLAVSSKKLVQLAEGRGSRDDISVMVVNLKHFCKS